MKGNEYNEVWAVISNSDDSLRKRLPGRFAEFVKNSLIPDAEQDISLRISGDHPVISDAAKEILTALYLTYWAEDKWQRRSLVRERSSSLAFQCRVVDRSRHTH